MKEKGNALLILFPYLLIQYVQYQSSSIFSLNTMQSESLRINEYRIKNRLQLLSYTSTSFRLYVIHLPESDATPKYPKNKNKLKKTPSPPLVINPHHLHFNRPLHPFHRPPSTSLSPIAVLGG